MWRDGRKEDWKGGRNGRKEEVWHSIHLPFLSVSDVLIGRRSL
jgi:hypothetical protein